MTMDRLLNLLLVEDSTEDAQLLLLHLDREGIRVEYRRVETEAAYQAALDSPPDLILSDFAMPRFNGLRALRILKDRGLDIPFILVSGTIGEDLAVDAIKQGADDYLMKDRLARLAAAIRSALYNKSLRDEKARADGALRNSEARYRNIFQTVPVSIWEEDFSALQAAVQELRVQGVTDFRSYIMDRPDFVRRAMDMVTVLDVNQTSLNFLNAPEKSQMLGSLAPSVDPDEFREELISFAEGNAYYEKETTGYNADGKILHFWMTQAFFTDADGRTIALVCFNDITARKQAEAATLRHLSELQALYENGLAINRLLNLREIGERIIATFARYLAWHHVTIRLRKDQSDELELIAFSVEDIRDDQKADLEKRFRSIVKVGQGLSGSVAQTGKPVRTGDLRDHPEFVAIFENMRSGLYMPLKTGDRVVGVISVESGKADAFSEQDERLLATLANQAAIAIENARLYQSVQEELAERKRVQDKLRESETLFRSLIENSSDEVSIIAQDGSLLYESPSSRPTLGYQPGEFLGQSLFQLVHPDDLERILSRLGELMRDKNLHPRERFRLRHRDGRWIWVEGVGTNLLEEPAVGGIVINYHDVTERVNAEEQIRYQALLLENVSDAVVSTDIDGLVVSWNKAAEELFEFPAADVIGRRATEVIETEYINSNEEDVGASLQETGAWNGEVRVTRKDGSAVYSSVSVSTIKDENGHHIGYLSLNHDITGRKLAEETLRLSENRYRMATTATNDVIWEWNFQTGQLIWSENAISVFGYPAEEIAPYESWWEDHVHPDDRPRVFPKLNSAIENGETHWADEYRFKRRDGSYSNISDRGYIEHGEDGRPLRMIGAMSDVTAVRRADKQIRDQLERLSGLHTIDIAIKSSFNLSTTLGILLEQVVRQLEVDAACVLVVNAAMSTLEFAAGYGFHTELPKRASRKLGESHAGRAILERRMVLIDNLSANPNDSLFAGPMRDENFVSYHGVPLVAKGMAIGVLEVFNRTSVRRDHDWLEFLNTLADQAAIAIDNAKLFEDLRISNIELTNAYEATIEGWSRALDLRDNETEGHTLRVTETTLQLAHIMGYPKDEMLQLRYGALLHDIGKMGVPDHILLKPDTLTPEEWQVMRMHPTFAHELLTPIRYLKSAALDIPYCHHEKWDGTGYPRKLMGAQIPLSARIFSVVDVWDAITSNRPYRSAWSRERALKHIRDESGKQFDPQVVDAFLRLIANQ